LCQLHVLNKIEDDLDESWECTKVIKSCEYSGMDMSTNHYCLVEWDNMNKSQSWVNFFALCLSNPTLVFLFARKHNLLHKMPYQHLVNYRKVEIPVDTARIHKVSTLLSNIKYKFGIQVPKGIKNAINLDKKNGNNLWVEAIISERLLNLS
jgi:hypothetical protein